jgi:hypothetical protein
MRRSAKFSALASRGWDGSSNYQRQIMRKPKRMAVASGIAIIAKDKRLPFACMLRCRFLFGTPGRRPHVAAVAYMKNSAKACWLAP